MKTFCLTTRWSRHFLTSRNGIAAVEFGLLSPVLLLLVVLTLDFAFAFYIKLRTITATSAAAQYVFQNGGDISGSKFAGFVSNVQSVVTTTAGLSTLPTVGVFYNNAPDTSNMGNFYCATGFAPVVWASTGSSSSSCGSLVQSGKFVTLVVDANASALFQNDPIIGKMINLTETVIVRVK